MLTPIYPPYNDTQKAYIAGFLLHYRDGILEALRSVNDPVTDQIPNWAELMRRYYQDAESVTRFLLHWTGYDVQKNEGWSPP